LTVCFGQDPQDLQQVWFGRSLIARLDLCPFIPRFVDLSLKPLNYLFSLLLILEGIDGDLLWMKGDELSVEFE
jgi:hypothetical protein